MGNLHPLIVNYRLTQVFGAGERYAAKAIANICTSVHQKNLGANKGYNTKGFVADMRRIGVTPHVAQNTARLSGS